MAAKSNVYFVDARVPITYITQVQAKRWYTHSLVYQTKELFGKVFGGLVKSGDKVAVKIHLGERYVQTYIRPIYVRKLVEKIKELGGEPFVCDTLFSGGKVYYDGDEPFLSRRNLKEGLLTAAMNGFTSETMGCPLLFADAPKGLRSRRFESNGKFIKDVYIAPAIADADMLVSFAHLKCHDCVSVGGTMKNLGVGCSSKQGKWWIHHSAKLEVNPERCNGCEECIPQCPEDAITLEEGKANINPQSCIDCAFCIDYCPKGAFTSRVFPTMEEQEARVAETAAGIVRYFDGKCAFLNLAMDIVPLCDCDPFQGVSIVPDIGVLASADPVALDRACIDLVNASPGIPGSMAEAANALQPGAEKLNAVAKVRWNATPGATHITPDWRVMMDAAEQAGLGSQEYELIRLSFGEEPKSIEQLFAKEIKR